MIETLFGNKTAARILVLLNQDEEGYAAQISRKLKIPLNMVQKQLERLSKGGILIPVFKGKVKNYRWNSGYPYYKPLKKFLSSVRLKKEGKSSFQHPDPADATNLSLRDRVKLAWSLSREGELLNPYPRPKPFVKTFNTLKDYESWRKKQTNPWIV